MNKIIPLLALCALLLMTSQSNRYDSLNSSREQIAFGIVLPISLCGSPGARTILKLMDTTKQMAPLMNNLGKYGMPIQTKSERAQLFFNQGINLYYGFNHLEAYRSFKEVARLDPENAMAYWGQALTLGPNINLPMDPADTEVVYKAVQKALSLSDQSTEKERMLIAAISKRYSAEALANRKPLDEAYANAMADVASKYPNDPDVQTLYAEALMDLHPWDFWKNGKPQPWTLAPVEVIKNALNKSPDHPGANHLNIHILEASAKPDDANASADRLRTLVPGAGHLVHMPSHIYIRTGRYQEGIEVNETAVKMDIEYITQCKVQGIYPLFYFPHNYHFLWACAMMTGQEKKTMQTATALMKTIPVELMGVKDYVTLQHWYTVPWYTMVRFGRWNEILQIPKPVDSLFYLKSVWHYARGMANVRLKNLNAATEELKQMEKIVSAPIMKELSIGGFNSFERVLSIGVNILDGEIHAARKDYTKAVASLKKAIEIEDGLLYQEPPDWYNPSRQLLGAILLEANRPSEAELTFQEDLANYPANGWSLFGLNQSLQKQGKKKEADATMKLFKEAFKNADVKLTSARK